MAHLEQIDDPGVLADELDRVRIDYNTVGMPGSATSPLTMNTKDEEASSASNAKKGCAPHALHASSTVDSTPTTGPDRGGEFPRTSVQLAQTYVRSSATRHGSQSRR